MNLVRQIELLSRYFDFGCFRFDFGKKIGVSPTGKTPNSKITAI
jgi:hypothetical protein